MGNQFWLIEDKATTISDVAAVVRKLGEDIKGFVIPEEARTKLLETLKRPDVSSILSPERIQWIWKDAKKLERVEDIHHYLINLSRIMEKEGAIQASMSSIAQGIGIEADLTSSTKIVGKPKRRKGRIHVKQRTQDIVNELPPEYKITKESEDVPKVWDSLSWHDRLAIAREAGFKSGPARLVAVLPWDQIKLVEQKALAPFIKPEKPGDGGLEEQFQEFTDLLVKGAKTDWDALFNYLKDASPEEQEDWVASLEWAFSLNSSPEMPDETRAWLYYSGILNRTAKLPFAPELVCRVRELEDGIRNAEKLVTRRAAVVEKAWDSLIPEDRADLVREAGFPEDVVDIAKDLSWKEFFSHAKYTHEDNLRELVHIIYNRYEEEPPEGVVETTTDVEARWNELDPEDRYKLALKAGFCDKRAKELSTLAWEGLCPMVKQDLDWVLKASPEELPEVKEHLWKNISVREGSLIAVKGKPAVVTHVDYEGGEPVVDYVTGPGEKEQWAYLDQIETVMAPEEGKTALESAIRKISKILQKELPDADRGQKEVLNIIRDTAPFIKSDAVLDILVGYIPVPRAEKIVDDIKTILYKELIAPLIWSPSHTVDEKKPPAKKLNAPDKWEHFIAPMIPRGGATAGGASYRGGGLEENEKKWFRQVHDTLVTAIKGGASDDEIEKLIDKLSLEYAKTNVGSKDHEEIRDVLWTFVGAISTAPKSPLIKDPFAAIAPSEAFPGQVPATGYVEADKKAGMVMYEEDLEEIIKKLEDRIQYMAEVSAAMAWSTPTDEMIEKYGDDVWVIATFGDATAVNGDPVDPDAATPKPPATHQATDYGGDIPTTEEEVSLESAVESVARDMGVSEEKVWKAADAAGYKPRHGMVYVSVSGESEVYAKEQEEEPATEANGDLEKAKVIQPKLDQKKRKAVNKELVEISKTFWNTMWDATAAIDAALKKEGLRIEDYTIRGAKEGQRTLDVLLGDEVVSNSKMVLSWYRHEETGRYEVTAYLS